MDKLVQLLVGLGIPGLILFLLISTGGYAGATAITVTLTSFGPGECGGVITLALVGLISSTVAEYGFDAVLKELIKTYKTQGYSKEEVLTNF